MGHVLPKNSIVGEVKPRLMGAPVSVKTVAPPTGKLQYPKFPTPSAPPKAKGLHGGATLTNATKPSKNRTARRKAEGLPTEGKSPAKSKARTFMVDMQGFVAVCEVQNDEEPEKEGNVLDDDDTGV